MNRKSLFRNNIITTTIVVIVLTIITIIIGNNNSNDSNSNIITNNINNTLNLITNSYALGNNSSSCLTRQGNEIVYNSKGKNCILLRSLSPTEHTNISNDTLERINGKSCTLTNSDNYANAESIAGVRLLNGATRRINCNSGYAGDITIHCDNGDKILGGKDSNCTFIGCKKYDENLNNTLNTSLSNIINSTLWNTEGTLSDDDKDTVLNGNRNTIYSKGDTIDIISCVTKIGYDLDNSSKGYILKCNGNDVITLETKDNGNGCNYNIKSCPNETIVLNNGTVTLNKVNHGEEVTATPHCNEGYNLISSNDYSYSCVDGNWVYNSGNLTCNKNCDAIDLAPILNIANGTLRVSATKGGETATPSLICNIGYEISNTEDYSLTCDNGDWIKNKGDEICSIKTCPLSDLTDTLTGGNVSSIVTCSDGNCSTTLNTTVTNINNNNSNNTTYNYDTYITISSCNTGYTTPTSNRILHCNADGEWEVYNNTGSNVCYFNGCTALSPVYDKNNNKVSDQLYNMVFTMYYSNGTNYHYSHCYADVSTSGASAVALTGSTSSLVTSTGTTIACAHNTSISGSSWYSNTNRQLTCSNDNNTKNGGYWKTKNVSCDLSTIKSTSGYTAYMDDFSGTNQSISSITKQYRLPIFDGGTNYDTLYTNKVGVFTLRCGTDGKWSMSKNANSCSGTAPTLSTGSAYYPSATDIMFVNNNNSGTTFDASALSEYSYTNTNHISSTLLSNSSYIFANGTKIEATCGTGYSEIDKNGVPNTTSPHDDGTHYYECVNGTWTARGYCGVKVDFYAPTLFDDVNNSGSIYKTIYPAVGASVDCTNAYFGGDPASGVVKVCRVKGFRYYKEGTTFTVQVPTTYTAHQFCHGSYIPRDLGMGLDGNASPTGWCSDFVTKTTYATVTDTAEGTITVERSGGSASSKAVLTCSSGSYIISSGQLSVTSTTGFAGSFCPQYGLFSGLIKQGKSATFYLYGGNGATVGSSTAGTGGYTKGVMVSGKMSSFLKTLYFYVGGNAVGTGGGYNGGGAGGLGAGGGGATHLATANGELSTLSGNKSAVLLVAGGGGGAAYNKYTAGNGGKGGGGNNSGNDGTSYDSGRYGRGGSLSSGGTGGSSSACTSASGSFGKGASASCYTSKDYGCGGGAGYYGGGSGGPGAAGQGGGGGSGYCNTSYFTCSGTTGGGGSIFKVSW